MVTTTTTIVTTTTTSGWCAAERDKEGVFTFRNVYQAYLSCRKRKRGSRDAQRYEVQLLDNLFDTLFRLQSNTYVPATPICFVAQQPKAREIHAAAFTDRVVHHWLVPRLSRLYEPIFIHDLYSNREGKGTHAAVKRLQSFMRSISQTQSHAYFLQLDIHNFFNSIDKPILFKLLQQRLRNALKQHKISLPEAQATRHLIHVLLKQDAAQALRVGHPHSFRSVPEHKRLGALGRDKGLPIGNLTSQFFANVYLNELDQFIKHRLKCRHYLRYVDDFMLLHQDPKQLQHWQQQIERFLDEHLQLRLKPDIRLRPISDGADFLGYIVRPHYCLVRRRVVGNLLSKLHGFEQRLWRGSANHPRLHLHRTEREKLYATLASYLGHFHHAQSYRLIRGVFRRFPWLALLFAIRPRHHSISLTPLWEPRSVSGYPSQIRWFRYFFPYAQLYLQRGRETDYFAPLATTTHALPKTTHPRHQVQRIDVREAGYLKGGLKRRLITRFYL